MKRFLLLAAVLPLAACATPAGPSTSSGDGTVTVAATMYPLAEAARRVGGDVVRVVQIATPGVEPHDFEPTPRDVAAMDAADLLLLNGAGIDAWAEPASSSRLIAGKAVLRFEETVGSLPSGEEGHENDEIGLEDEEGHEEHGPVDPHYWLDPLRMRAFTLALGVELATVDPANAETYRANADAYAAELDLLHRQYVDGLGSCNSRDIVVAHDAFGYLADSYDLQMHAIAGISPEDEPSPQRMAELAELVRQKGIDAVFFESLTSPRLAETIADEAGVKTAVLNPLESLSQGDIASGSGYISVMGKNLKTLRFWLACR